MYSLPGALPGQGAGAGREGQQRCQDRGSTHIHVVGVNIVGIRVSQHRVEFHSVPIIWKHRAGGHGVGTG